MNGALSKLSLLLCAAALASCSAYQTSTSSWWFRYHPEEDEAVYVEIQDGLTADAEAAPTLRRLVGGWRRYPPEGGLIDVDLDAEPDWKKAAPRHQERVKKLRELFQGLQREVEVVEAGGGPLPGLQMGPWPGKMAQARRKKVAMVSGMWRTVTSQACWGQTAAATRSGYWP